MRFTHVLCAAAAATCLSGGWAAAQSVDFGPEFATFFTNTTSTTVSVPAGDTGEQTITLVHSAGYTPTPGGPNLRVLVDGVTVGEVAAGQDCSVSLNDTFTIPDSVYTTAAADGSITLQFSAIGTTGTGVACTGANAFGAPFDTMAPPAFSILAVQGSLSTSGSSPTAPEAGGAAQQTTAALTRGAMILANGPTYERRVYRLKGEGGVARGFSFEGNQLVSDAPVKLDVGRNELNFRTIQGGGLWAEGSYTDISDDASNDQWFGVLHAGADALVADGVLLGVSVQFDRLSSTDSASGDDFDGSGWMIGPYVTAQLAPNLYLDGRLAFGTLETDVDRAGGAGTDTYDSDRTLAELILIGDRQYGAYTIEPRAELAWYRETSDPYTSVTLGSIGETEVELGQAVLGGRVIRAGSFAGGQLTPYVDLSTAYTYYDTGSATVGSFGDAFEGWSGSVGLGVAFNGRGGSEWTVDATFTGAGDGASATGLRAGVVIPF